MKKGLKKLIAGAAISAALCLPILGTVTPTTTASAYSDPTFDHLDDVFDQISKLEDVYAFDEWFGAYWDKNSYRYPNASALSMYFTFLNIWEDMKNPPGAGIKPPSLIP